MTAQEIDSLIQEKLGSQPGFDAAASQQFAGHVADAIAVSGVKALGGKACASSREGGWRPSAERRTYSATGKSDKAFAAIASRC